jgi:hypothetical protein
MTISLALLLMLTGAPQSDVTVTRNLDDTTKPQRLMRRLRDSEIATYVVNNGVYPAGIVGEVGEAFFPDGTSSRAGRYPQRGTYRIDRGRLCVTFGQFESCRLLYVDELGVFFSSAQNLDGTAEHMTPLDSH